MLLIQLIVADAAEPTRFCVAEKPFFIIFIFQRTSPENAERGWK